MKKAVLLISILLPELLSAAGPKFRHKESEKQLEFENVYQDIRSVAVVSSATLPGGSTQYAPYSGSTSYIQNQTTYQLNANLNISTGNVMQINAVNAVSGGTVDSLFYNTSNTASSNSRVFVRVGGTSAGDPFTVYGIDGGTTWGVGADNSDADSYKVSKDGVLGTNDYFIVTTAGEITKPLQPSFLVTNSAGASNVTGDGTVYGVPWGNEIYDQGGDFSSSTFTAPVTGRYFLQVSTNWEGILNTHTYRALKIVTSNRNYVFEENEALAQTYASFHVSVIADMDANDTVTITFEAGGATKVLDLAAGAQDNFYSGALIH